MTPSEQLLEIARALAEGETSLLPGRVMIEMCKAFGGHYWFGTFDHVAQTQEGRHERVVALCFAAAVLK